MLKEEKAIINRVYTGKTHLRGLKILYFWLVYAGGICLYSSDSTAWRKPYYIRRKLFKHPLRVIPILYKDAPNSERNVRVACRRHTTEAQRTQRRKRQGYKIRRSLTKKWYQNYIFSITFGIIYCFSRK
jgi:hypothetical protein